MGAWGAGNFENDTALDWVWELGAATGLDLVERAIADVLNCTDDLDADLGSIGLAAAEVVAALRHKPVDGLPPEVSEWVAALPVDPDESLAGDCVSVVDKIRNDDISELKDLWEEDEETAAEWHLALDDLVARLS